MAPARWRRQERKRGKEEMPKMKTHRGAAKRLKRTGTGKFVRAQAGVRHLLEHKSGQRRRSLQRRAGLSPGEARRPRKLRGNRSRRPRAAERAQTKAPQHKPC